MTDSSASDQTSKLSGDTAGERLVEIVAAAIMREARWINDPAVQRDFDPGFIDTTRVWARKYASAAIEAQRVYLSQMQDMVTPMISAYRSACGEQANRYGMAAARNALLAPAVKPADKPETDSRG